jgi:hypothetical protein
VFTNIILLWIRNFEKHRTFSNFFFKFFFSKFFSTFFSKCFSNFFFSKIFFPHFENMKKRHFKNYIAPYASSDKKFRQDPNFQIFCRNFSRVHATISHLVDLFVHYAFEIFAEKLSSQHHCPCPPVHVRFVYGLFCFLGSGPDRGKVL